MKYFIGNFKANKNYFEIMEWIDAFISIYKVKENVTIGICPPYPFLGLMQDKLGKLGNIFVGAQTVSSYEQGSYTGEVTARSLEGTVRFAIIGHSERRKTFKETDEELALKVALAKKYNIEPIYCIRDEKDVIPPGVTYVAYEPVAAIGTGQNESLDKVLEMKSKLSLPNGCIFIYGGSVNEKNVNEYLVSHEIDGFLIGKASLTPETFLQIAR